MSSIIQEAGDGILELLENNFPELDISKTYFPAHDAKNIDSTKISIIPMELNISRATRSKSFYNLRIDVAINKKLTNASNEEIDGMFDEVESIIDTLDAVKIETSNHTFIINSVENNPIISDEHYREHNEFTSIIRCNCLILK